VTGSFTRPSRNLRLMDVRPPRWLMLTSSVASVGAHRVICGNRAACFRGPVQGAMLSGQMSQPACPRPLPRLRAAWPSAAGLLHSPCSGDPWADLGLLGLAKSACRKTPPANPGALRAFINRSPFPVNASTAEMTSWLPCFPGHRRSAIFRG